MNPVIQRIQTLSSKAFQSASSIAIVGNGGTHESDNEIIEGSDCVVRFNNYATRKGVTGTKERFRCDTLFTTFDLHSDGSEPNAVVIGIPFPFSHKHVERKLGKWYGKSAPFVLNPYVNLHLLKELGLENKSEGFKHPIPSVGFTAVWHLFNLMKFQRNWKPKVFIAGFKWYSDPKTLKIQDRKVSLPRAWHFNHHYREEMKWMIDNIMDHPDWSFSPECYDILKTFKPHL